MANNIQEMFGSRATIDDIAKWLDVNPLEVTADDIKKHREDRSPWLNFITDEDAERIAKQIREETAEDHLDKYSSPMRSCPHCGWPELNDIGRCKNGECVNSE